ncbi:hypothetical protein NIIDMKKI_59450 [Mycobacterium kansasii]|uniref:Uncharacterized protein n=1 Tax=Mycobacterium kansasii TaxID=1768 RepID=A0A7G1ILM8_MYCKA|nr:hypothetical protein NIIDMKKI_59450 [Mycobacterium kansasii]
MWVLPIPAMSAATADTRDSSSYQDLSIGSRDSANAATAPATKTCASAASQPPSAAITRARASSAGSNNCRCARKFCTRLRSPASKNRLSPVASIDVNTRNGLRASSFA